MMSLQQQINDDIKDAMKARNADRLAALRAVKSAIMLEATKEGTTIVPDKVSLKLIARLVKQRKDSAAIYAGEGRNDLADPELKEAELIQQFLPKALSEAEVKEVVKSIHSD